MKVISGGYFEMMRNKEGCVSDLDFDHCAFCHCRAAAEEDPARRIEIRRVRLHNCRACDCGIQRAVFEDVVVDGLQMETHDLLMIWGSVFNRVVLRGQFANININQPYTSRLVASRNARYRQLMEIQQKFNEADDQYYRNVDWALDIREAQVLGLKIDGVPVHLIRRDSATQAVVLRKHINEQRWKTVDLAGTWWKSTLVAAANKTEGDLVLVAPKLHKSFEVQVEGIRRLREAGIAEPD
jgi:hypothetical protein